MKPNEKLEIKLKLASCDYFKQCIRRCAYHNKKDCPEYWHLEAERRKYLK